MKVEPYEGLLRFHVYSENQPGEIYLVDLAENGGLGKCTCHHYRIRLEPKLGFGRHVNPEDVQCKHLLAAKEYLGKELTETLIKAELKKEKERKN